MNSTPPLETLVGSITSVGFDSGHRFVIGHWPHSPIGSFADVMWRDAADDKRLIASETAADFVTEVYPFDERIPAPVTVTEFRRRRLVRHLRIEAGPLELEIDVGALILPFPPRPRRVTSSVESRIASLLLGVKTHGRSPTGVEEWYRTRSVQPVVAARGRLDGQDLGTIGRLQPAVDFGLSEPPARPTHVRLRVDLRR